MTMTLNQLDSMAMEVDEPGSDFGSDAGHAPQGRKARRAEGKRQHHGRWPRESVGVGEEKRHGECGPQSASEVMTYTGEG